MEPKVYSNDKSRKAKGYSYAEIRKANLNVKSARKLGLRVDMRRSTLYDDNVASIKKAIMTEKKKKEYKKKGKKIKSQKTKKAPPKP
jgi:ribosomal protein L13E